MTEAESERLLAPPTPDAINTFAADPQYVLDRMRDPEYFAQYREYIDNPGHVRRISKWRGLTVGAMGHEHCKLCGLVFTFHACLPEEFCSRECAFRWRKGVSLLAKRRC